MIIEIATITVTEGREAEFEEAFANAQRYIAGSPHALRYQLTRCIELPSRYVLRIEWDSLEGHTEAFRGSPEYQEYRALLYPLYAMPPEVVHYNEVITSTQAQGAGAR
ncbi:MAG TPA: antibiotic biosynthesis monooxygenase [Chloroflexota bacterium]|jgi:heme-degrading monooxygenase HmoA|nr:antibiotic biosynthesis monooxygenase [Chloroflexota bacterium]